MLIGLVTKTLNPKGFSLSPHKVMPAAVMRHLELPGQPASCMRMGRLLVKPSKSPLRMQRCRPSKEFVAGMGKMVKGEAENSRISIRQAR